MCDESIICRRNGCYEEATTAIQLDAYTKHLENVNVDMLKMLQEKNEKIRTLDRTLENLKIEDARLVRCNNDAYNSNKALLYKIEQLQKIIDNGVSHIENARKDYVIEEYRRAVFKRDSEEEYRRAVFKRDSEIEQLRNDINEKNEKIKKLENSLCNRIPTIQMPRDNVIELYRSENKDLKEQIKNKDSEIAYLKGVNMGKQIKIDELKKYSAAPPDMSGVAFPYLGMKNIIMVIGKDGNAHLINLDNIYEGTIAFKSGVIDDFEKGCFWILEYMTKDGPMDIATLKQVIFDCPDKAMYAYKFLRDQLLKLINGDE